MALLVGHLDDTHGDITGDLTHPRQSRVYAAFCPLLIVEAVGQGKGALRDHLIANSSCLAEGTCQTDAGEDVEVVALTRNEVLSLVVEFWEWTSRGKDDGSLCCLDRRLEVALGQVRGIRQGEDNRTLVELRHALQDLLGKGVRDRAETDDGSRLDVLDCLDQCLALLALVVVSSKVNLVLRELVSTAVILSVSFSSSLIFPHRERNSLMCHETLGVTQPDAVLCLFVGKALTRKEALELHGNTDTGAACTEEEDLLVVKGPARGLAADTCRICEATEDDGAGALDVVVENTVVLLVAVQEEESALGAKVLELDDEIGVLFVEGVHDLVEELGVLGIGRPFSAETKVEGILELLLVVGTKIDADGNSSPRVNACSSDIEAELTDADPNAIPTLVSETKDTTAVGQDGNAGCASWDRPVVNDLGHLALVLQRDGQTFWPAVDLGELLASLANHGRVNERQALLGVLHDDGVEEADIGNAKCREEDVLAELCLL